MNRSSSAWPVPRPFGAPWVQLGVVAKLKCGGSLGGGYGGSLARCDVTPSAGAAYPEGRMQNSRWLSLWWAREGLCKMYAELPKRMKPNSPSITRDRGQSDFMDDLADLSCLVYLPSWYPDQWALSWIKEIDALLRGLEIVVLEALRGWRGLATQVCTACPGQVLCYGNPVSIWVHSCQSWMYLDEMWGSGSIWKPPSPSLFFLNIFTII